VLIVSFLIGSARQSTEAHTSRRAYVDTNTAGVTPRRAVWHDVAMADSENNQDPTDLNIPVGHDELVIRNRYETLSTANDFLIGVMFVVGSVLFLSESTSTVGTWFFIVGSVQLLIRPSIRLARRIHLQRFDTPDRTDHGGDY
jgi:hypothetical protein